MSAEPPSPAIRLPVWRLVKASLASVFRHLDNFVSRVWPWVAIIAAATMLVGVVLKMSLEEKSPATVVLGLILSIGSIMVAVSWHRGLLLGEPGGPMSAFRLDGAFLRYIGGAIIATLVVIICLAVPLGAIGFALSTFLSNDEAAIGAGLALAVVLPIAVPLSARLLLVLPMAAVDDPSPLLRGAWRLGRGNGWRLAGALLLLSLIGALIQYGPILTVSFVIGLVAGEDTEALLQSGFFHLMIYPLATVTGLLNAGLFASLASYAYAVLTNHPLGREVTG